MIATAGRKTKRKLKDVASDAGGRDHVHGPLCGRCTWPVDPLCGECEPAADGTDAAEERQAEAEPRPTSRPCHGRQIVDVPLDKLHRHPGNRTIKDSTCKELAKDLQARGLLQPIQIRDPGTLWQLPEGHWQIVFGERRAIAARLAGWDTIPAEIVTLDDRQTQEAIAAENGHRAQLNDIERARRLAELTKPVQDGGGGLTQTAAAAAMGIDQSTAATLLKLLTLPKQWQELVIAGAIPGSHLRPLLPYADCPPILKLLAEDYQWAAKSEWPEERAAWATRDAIARSVEDVIENETRALTPDDVSPREYDRPRFKATADRIAELQVVEIPLGDKTVSRCLNVDAWRKLQDSASKRPAGKSKPAASAAGGNGKPVPAAKPSSADIRAAEKEQDRQLAERIKRPQGLAEIALRLAIATAVAERVKRAKSGCRETEAAAEALLLGSRDVPGSRGLDVRKWRYSANRLLRADRGDETKSKPKSVSKNWYMDDRAYALYALDTDRDSDDYRSDGEIRNAYFARLILWPQSDGRIFDRWLAKPGELPDRWPVIDEATLGDLAYELGASIRDTWEAATRTGPARLWLDAFLATHQTRRHLVGLCEELGVLNAAMLTGKETLDALRRAIVGQHEQRQLQLPESLKGYPKAAKRAKARA